MDRAAPAVQRRPEPQPRSPIAPTPEADLEPVDVEPELANTLLANPLAELGLDWLAAFDLPDFWLADLFGDFLGLAGAALGGITPEPAAVLQTGPGEAPPTGPVTAPTAAPEDPAVPQTQPAGLAAPGVPPVAVTSTQPRPGATEPAPEVQPGEAPESGRTGAGGPPVTPDEIRARTSAAAAGLSRPTGPKAARARAPFDQAAQGIVVRTETRTNQLLARPARLAGSPPAHRALPRPDPGPIPKQLEAVRKLFGRKLKPATLPPVTPSPRGTLPDFTLPVLTAAEIRHVLLGEESILMFTRAGDPESLEERAKLLEVRKSLGQQTATAPPPVAIGLPFLPVPGPQLSAPVVDERVLGVGLPEGQRELFAAVVSQLKLDPAAQAKQILTAVRLNHSAFPGGALEQAFPEEMRPDGGLLTTITATVAREVDALAEAIRLTPEELHAALQDRRAEVQKLRAAAGAATAQGTILVQQAAVKGEARTRAAAKATAWAANQAVAADRAIRRHPNRTQARVEKALAELKEPVAIELARLDEQLRQRERAIADAVRQQISAIRLAQTKDEIALTPAKPADEQVQDRLLRAEVLHWADKAVADLAIGDTSKQAELIAAAKAQTATYKAELEVAAMTALAALQAWGTEHVRKTEGWWTELDGQLQLWATDAAARASLWETQQGHATRLALLQDLESLQRLSAIQSAGAVAEADAYVARLDAEARTFIGTFAGGAKANAPDLAGAMAASLSYRIRAKNQEPWEPPLFNAVLAVPETPANYPPMERLLKLVEPEMNIAERVGAIHTSVTRWRGFDEEAIFKALGGLSPLAAKLLEWKYRMSYEDLRKRALPGKGHAGHLSSDELRTAAELLRGDRVQGAVGAIHSAISGPGAEMDAVNRILRALTPDERTRVVSAYLERYGVSLASDLDSQWSVSRLEAKETLQISTSHLAEASATALQRTVTTVHVGGGQPGYGAYRGAPQRLAIIDKEAAGKVFTRIQEEVKAEGARKGWITDQINAEITFRSHELGLKFDEQAKNEWWAKEKPGLTASQAAFSRASPAGRDLLQGMLDYDLAKIDLARIRLEDEGIYADDAALNQVFRDQASRSLEEVQRDYGPALGADTERRLDSEEPFPDAEARVNRRLELEREKAAELMKLADSRTEKRMTALDAAYRLRSGRSLEAMVEDNMSFTSKQEGLTRVRQQGVLTNYQKLRFAIEGLGTDMPMLKATLGTMSKAEIETADKLWREHHDDESLIDAIKGDTSGRDQGDLVDLATYGAPQTARQIVAAALRKNSRDRSGETAIGRWLTSSETDLAIAEVNHLVDAYAALRRPGASREDQRRASLTFDLAVERANIAIELQRQALDSVADALANAAAIVAAVIVGVVAAPFTGGGSAILAAAIIGSIVATTTSIVVKQAVKGAAYGREELYTDLAVGAVDLAVAIATAGLGNALLGRRILLRGVERSALFGLLSKLGAPGRALASGQARIAGALGRLGSEGLLVRKLGGVAFLKGFENSKSAVVRLIGRGSAQVIEQAVQAVPTSLTGALLDESLYRQPGGPRRLLNNTITGTVHSTVMGLGVAGGLHLGGIAARGIGRGVGSMFRSLAGAGQPDLGVPRLPEVPGTGDLLAHAGTPRERLAEFQQWRALHPEGTLPEFHAERTARLSERLRAADIEQQRIREARRELLAELPAQERGQYADVPIRPVSDAEFARLTGGSTDGAHLLVRDGQAQILVREGAAPGAVARLLPEVQQRVFPSTYGLAVEGALPPHLRDTPIRIDTTLPREEVRVVPIPKTGRITGVAVLVGPGTHPIDVALHAGEITRIRGWMGRLGAARTALAKFGTRVGFEPVSPLDRTRFEAAGEVGKLGPIIEERIRRTLRARDPAVAARLEAQTLRLLAQHERAHKILTGELKPEPRSYIAQEGEPPAPKATKPTAEAAAEPAAVKPTAEAEPAAVKPTAEAEPAAVKPTAEAEPAAVKPTAEAEPAAVKPTAEAEPAVVKPTAEETNAARELRLLRKKQERIKTQLEYAEARAPEVQAHANDVRAELQLLAQEFGRNFKKYSWMEDIDLSDPGQRERFERQMKSWPQPPALPKDTKTIPQTGRSDELIRHWQRLQNAESQLPTLVAAHEDLLARVRAEKEAAELAAKHWSGMMKKQADVPISPKLPEPWAGWDWQPKELRRGTAANKESHLNGYRAELNLANHIVETFGHTVLKYGAPNTGEGRHGADVISIDAEGNVYLWDSKYLRDGTTHPSSSTFAGDFKSGTFAGSTLDKALLEAISVVRSTAAPALSPVAQARALANLAAGNFTALTLSSRDTVNFHSGWRKDFVGGKASETRLSRPPWEEGK